MEIEVDQEYNLIKSETLSIKKLQQELKQSLPRLERYQLTEQGFVEDNHRIITLQLQSMNLKTLPVIIREFTSLRTLRLGKNHLNTLDLNLLQNCSELRILDLGHNMLKSIDLTPLQGCLNLKNLLLQSNQLQTIDLTPLKHCHQLNLLDLKQNRIQNINLDFLHQSKGLWCLDLSSNPLTSLNITPLLSLPKLEIFLIDNNVSLEAFPILRDYSQKLHWFVSQYLPRVKWIMTKEDAQYESLFAMYQNIVKHFRHDEFWADYRDRRLAHPPQRSDESHFFEYVVQNYLAIKDRKRTEHYNEDAENRDIRTPCRRKIKIQLQDRFLNAIDLTSTLKEYWEPGNEPRLTINLLEGAPLEGIVPEIIVLHFWLDTGPSQMFRVSTVTWVRIYVNEDTHSYQVRFGFNRGYLRAGKKYHPIPPPDEFPANAFTSTEVTYEIKSFTTSNVLDIVTQGHEWLKEGYYPKFNPDWPDDIYEGGALQLGF